jgi:hypothetical protein
MGETCKGTTHLPLTWTYRLNRLYSTLNTPVKRVALVLRLRECVDEAFVLTAEAIGIVGYIWHWRAAMRSLTSFCMDRPSERRSYIYLPLS